jgi:hypothetical protein
MHNGNLVLIQSMRHHSCHSYTCPGTELRMDSAFDRSSVDFLRILSIVSPLDKRALQALCLTNKGLLSWARPLLYKHFDLGFQVFTSTPPVIVFQQSSLLVYRTLSAKEFLRAHVRQLRIRINNQGRKKKATDRLIEGHPLDGYTMLLQLVGWLVDVRCLSIEGNRRSVGSHLPWGLMIHISEEMKLLEEITIKYDLNIKTSALLRFLRPTTQLRLLDLQCDGLHWCYHSESLAYPIVANLGSQNLLELRLTRVRDTALVKEFLPMCKNLRSLSWSCLELESNQTIQDLLFPIRNTLKELSLWAALPRSESNLKLHQLQLSGLPLLEHFSVGGWSFDSDDQPTKIQQALLTDSLHSFTFTYYGDWTAALAKVMREAFLQATCLILKNATVQIVLHPDYDENQFEELSQEMELLANELSKRGIATQCSARTG